MRGIRIGGVHGLLLSSQELADILECVEAYCVGATGEEALVDPEIRNQYPGERFTIPVAERFWRLHAAVANRTSTRKAKTAGGNSES